MAKVKEQVDMKKAAVIMEGASIRDVFTKVQVSDLENWADSLKIEIVTWGNYDIGVSELTKDYIKNNWRDILLGQNGLDDLYIIDETTSLGKANTYLYSVKGNIVFKIPKTRIGKHVVHSVEELDKVKGKSEEYNLIKSEATLVEVDGITYYEPNLSGFDLDTTNIVYYEVGENIENSILVPAKEYLDGGKSRTIEKDGTTYEFYNYNAQKWGNILVEKNGIKTWWVWVPRYCYKETDVSDVKFIDLDSTPEEGYIVHSNFIDGKKGIWVSKYEPVMTVKTEVLEIPYYMPDMTGFNRENTYIEVYNSEEEKFEETKLSTISNLTEFAKQNTWFDYNNQIWANIKTVNPESNTGDTESWWVWIPRYAYNINGTETGIIFVDTNNKPLDGSTLPGNYTIHPAFTIKETVDGEEKTTELKGIWVSKYEPIQK